MAGQKMGREARNHMRKMNNLRRKELKHKEAEERNAVWRRQYES